MTERAHGDPSGAEEEQRKQRLYDLAVTHMVINGNVDSFKMDGTTYTDITTNETVLVGAVFDTVVGLNTDEDAARATLREIESTISEDGGLKPKHYKTALATIRGLVAQNEDLQQLDFSYVRKAIDTNMHKAKPKKWWKKSKEKNNTKRVNCRLTAMAAAGGLAFLGGLYTAVIVHDSQNELPAYSSAAGRSNIQGELETTILDLKRIPPHQNNSVDKYGNEHRTQVPASLPDTFAAWQTLNNVRVQLSGTGSGIEGRVVAVQRTLFNPSISNQEAFSQQRGTLEEIIPLIRTLSRTPQASSYNRDAAIVKASNGGLLGGLAVVGAAGGGLAWRNRKQLIRPNKI